MAGRYVLSAYRPASPTSRTSDHAVQAVIGTVAGEQREYVERRLDRDSLPSGVLGAIVQVRPRGRFVARQVDLALARAEFGDGCHE